jgi:hypothetical protein
MTRATLGFAFSVGSEPYRTPARRVAATRLIQNPSWGSELRHLSAIAVSGKQMFRRPGTVRKAAMLEVLNAAFESDATATVDVATSARSDDGEAHCAVDSQIQPWGHLRPRTFGHRPWAPAETVERWLADVLLYAEAVSPAEGVVFVLPTRHAAFLEEYMSAIVGNEHEAGHPFPEQLRRMSRHEKEVGTRYVRFPRWGTLYSHEHVTALGGTPRITAAVQPAVVRELSGGVYFQMTDSLDTALSQESIAKQRAFEEVAAPLLPPTV